MLMEISVYPFDYKPVVRFVNARARVGVRESVWVTMIMRGRVSPTLLTAIVPVAGKADINDIDSYAST